MQDLAQLRDMKHFWKHLDFAPWDKDGMQGVHRRVSMVKDGMLGKVAEYHVDDYIIWTHRGRTDEEEILRRWKSQPEVIKYRFLLVGEESSAKPRNKALWLGLGGFVEVLRHRPGGPGNKNFQDLIFLVDKGLEYAEKGVGMEENPSEAQ